TAGLRIAAVAHVAAVVADDLAAPRIAHGRAAPLADDRRVGIELRVVIRAIHHVRIQVGNVEIRVAVTQARAALFGLNGVRSTDPSSPATAAAISSATTGAIRMPLRYSPDAWKKPGSRSSGPRIGSASGVPGRYPAHASRTCCEESFGRIRSAACDSAASPDGVGPGAKPTSSTVAPTRTRSSERGTT